MFGSIKTRLIIGTLIIATLISLPFLYQQAGLSDAAPGDTFRVTEYFLDVGTFIGTTHEITLNQDLASNYFVIVQGSDGDGSSGGDRGPDENYVSLTSDPFGTGDLTASSGSDRIGLTRNTAVNSWVGVITVAECTADCNTSGFQLLDAQRVNHPGTDTSGTDTSNISWTTINQVMLMGGFNGSGCDTTQTSTANTKACHARIFPSGSDTIEWTRSNVGATLSAATSTVMVLQWGSEWTVQRVTVNGNAGGNGAAAVNQYNSVGISNVARDNTWVWGTGHTNDQGIGDAAEGTLITLGNGVNQFATENTVAVGQEYSDTRSFEVYALTHPDVNVDYRFKPDGDTANITVDQTVDSATDTVNRMALVTNGQNGTGNAYPRPMLSARYVADNTVRLQRRRSGQNFPAWIQGIDFGGISPSVDLSTSTKTHDDADNTVTPLQNITFTIVLRNTGTITATGVDLDETIDSNLENLSVTSTNNCGASVVDGSTGTTLDIDNLVITTSTDCTVTYTVNVVSGVTGGTVISNTTTVGAPNEGGAAFNLSAPNLTVTPNADISVGITSSITEASTGDFVTYTVTATNNAAGPTTELNIIDVLPSGLSFVSATPAQGTYSDSTGVWAIGVLAGGANTTLDILVSIDNDAGADIINTATVNVSNPPDFIISNNAASVTVDVLDGGTLGTSRRPDEVPEGEEGEETPVVVEEEGPPMSECPHIFNPYVCNNLTLLFGDLLTNVRQEPEARLRGAYPEPSCLSLDSSRNLRFSDVSPTDSSLPFVNLLKNTQVNESGEYIVSGLGESEESENVVAEFGPYSPLTREAIVKTILLSNCIPIAEETPVPEDGFRFNDIDVADQGFTARLFYTAYQNGIVKGYRDGSGRPNRQVTTAETITMLLRSIGVNLEKPSDGPRTWYVPALNFASSNAITHNLNISPSAKTLRRDFAVMLVRTMAFHPDPRIHSYVERVNVSQMEFDETLPVHEPLPLR